MVTGYTICQAGTGRWLTHVRRALLIWALICDLCHICSSWRVCCTACVLTWLQHWRFLTFFLLYSILFHVITAAEYWGPWRSLYSEHPAWFVIQGGEGWCRWAANWRKRCQKHEIYSCTAGFLGECQMKLRSLGTLLWVAGGLAGRPSDCLKEF